MDNKQTDFEAIIKKACDDSLEAEYEQYLKDTEAHIQPDPIAQKKAMKKIRAALLKTSHRYKSLKKTVITCVLALVIFTGVSLTVEPVRAYVGKIVEKWFDNAIQVSFKPEENKEYPKKIENLLVPKPDEGWKTIEVDMGRKEKSVIYNFTAPDGSIIAYSQNTIDESLMLSSKKLITLEDIALKNGNIAQCYIYSDGSNVLIWENDYIFCISSETHSKETLIKLANTLY